MALHSTYKRAVVVHANYAQFAPGQTIRNGPVGSRMLLWSKAGTGTISVNKINISMETGCLLILPWRHTVHYEASRDDPFLLAGIHLVPDHDLNKRVQFAVPHMEDHPLFNVHWRRDVGLAGIPDFRLDRLVTGSPLAHLLEYVVGVFVRTTPAEWHARELAGLVLHELATMPRSDPDRNYPLELQRMLQYVEFNHKEPVSLSDLVEFSKLSPATIGRMFRKFLNVTPVTWIMRIKIERAQLLLRTRRFSISEVAKAVGFNDPYYFSKCFKKITGKPPQAYRHFEPWL